MSCRQTGLSKSSVALDSEKNITSAWEALSTRHREPCAIRSLWQLCSVCFWPLELAARKDWVLIVPLPLSQVHGAIDVFTVYKLKPCTEQMMDLVARLGVSRPTADLKVTKDYVNTLAPV